MTTSGSLPSERAPEVALRERHAGGRVLLAEDNPINQRLASGLLRVAGLLVDVAADGLQAVGMARAGRYDLILMDLQMPQMDGLQATRAIRALPGFAATPIVALTANSSADDRAACLAAGMNDHLGKPVNPRLLYETLLHWLGGGRAATARAPAGVAPVALPQVPGLDTARGLKFFAGRPASYLRTLRTFVEMYADGLAGMQPYLDDPQPEALAVLRRDVHQLGGAGAALGAVVLETLAQRIEILLRSGASERAVRPLLSELQQSLTTLVQQLNAQLPPESQPPEPRA